MIRRRSLIVQGALLGMLGVLAFPSSSSALRLGLQIALTANGPSPAAGKIPAGMYPIWINQDTVTHTVSFANGCSFDVAAGSAGYCGGGLWNVVGDYAYTVDGTAQASVSVTPEWRAVTLKAKHHGFRLGSRVRLHGSLAIANVSPPSLFGPRMPVTVFARPDRDHPFHRIAVVIATPFKKPRPTVHSAWHLWVRPHAHTTYMVEANSQPPAGQFWENARSGLFGVYARR